MATAQTTGSTRFPELKPEQMTDAQKRAYEGIVGGPSSSTRASGSRSTSGTPTGSSR